MLIAPCRFTLFNSNGVLIQNFFVKGAPCFAKITTAGAYGVSPHKCIDNGTIFPNQIFRHQSAICRSQSLPSFFFLNPSLCSLNRIWDHVTIRLPRCNRIRACLPQRGNYFMRNPSLKKFGFCFAAAKNETIEARLINDRNLIVAATYALN